MRLKQINNNNNNCRKLVLVDGQKYSKFYFNASFNTTLLKIKVTSFFQSIVFLIKNLEIRI